MDLEYGVNTSCHRCHQKQSQNQSQHPDEMLLSVFVHVSLWHGSYNDAIIVLHKEALCIQLLLQENEMQVLLPPLLLWVCLHQTQRPTSFPHAATLQRNATIHIINDKEKQRTTTTMKMTTMTSMLTFRALRCFPLCDVKRSCGCAQSSSSCMTHTTCHHLRSKRSCSVLHWLIMVSVDAG